MSWNPSSDDVGVIGYTLYVNGTATRTINGGLEATASALACGTTYTIGVDAFDDAGNHSAAATTTVTTSDCTTQDQPPTVPTDVTATPVTRQAITLDWTKASDDVKVKGYTVYVNGTVFKTVGAWAAASRVNGLTCGTTYTLGVDAYDAAGNHSAVATAVATTVACRAASQSQSQ